MNSRLIALFLMLGLGLEACQAAVPVSPSPEPATPTPEVFNPLPADQRAFETVRAKLATQLDIDPLALVLVDVTPVDWPDSCLGSPTSGEVCSQVITPGFRVRLRDGDAIYEFHTDHDAKIIRQYSQ